MESNILQLFQHQFKAIAGARKYNARLFYRIPGTGKTMIAATIAFETLTTHKEACVLWIGPANLIPQNRQVFESIGVCCSTYTPKEDLSANGCCVFVSYETLRAHLEELSAHKWDLVLCDEFHYVKNPKTKNNMSVKAIRRIATRFYAFTGTPFQNSAYEFFELFNVISGDETLSQKCVKTLMYQRPKTSWLRRILEFFGRKLNRLNQGPIIGVKDPERLHALIARYIDYLPSEVYSAECRLPHINSEIIYVKMDKEEISTYRSIKSKYRKKKERAFLENMANDESMESAFINLSELRQCLLGLNGHRSSKIERCASDISIFLEDAHSKILVFSNFVENGLDNAAIYLSEIGIEYMQYDGMSARAKREDIIKQYMNSNIRVMLLSPVGFEGLDLYGTTHILILDPHYNPERTTQLISRAVRAFSNVHTIEVRHYIASMNNDKELTIDECIVKIAERKKKVMDIMINCMRSSQ